MSRKTNSEYWQQVLSTQMSSELTQLEWCEQNDVNIHNFRYWKRRLSSQPETVADLSQTKWALVTESKFAAEHETDTSSLLIHVGKATVEVHCKFDSRILSDVVAVLMKYV